MTRIKMHISNVKLPFYPSCEIKYGLQNRVSTAVVKVVVLATKLLTITVGAIFLVIGLLTPVDKMASLVTELSASVAVQHL